VVSRDRPRGEIVENGYADAAGQRAIFAASTRNLSVVRAPRWSAPLSPSSPVRCSQTSHRDTTVLFFGLRLGTTWYHFKLVAWHSGRTSVWRTFSVLRSTCSWPMSDGRRDSGHYYTSWATSVTVLTVGLSTYGGMPKPGSTYGRSRNSAETTLAETETEQKVILEAFRCLCLLLFF